MDLNISSYNEEWVYRIRFIFLYNKFQNINDILMVFFGFRFQYWYPSQLLQISFQDQLLLKECQAQLPNIRVRVGLDFRASQYMIPYI